MLIKSSFSCLKLFKAESKKFCKRRYSQRSLAGASLPSLVFQHGQQPVQTQSPICSYKMRVPASKLSSFSPPEEENFQGWALSPEPTSLFSLKPTLPAPPASSAVPPPPRSFLIAFENVKEVPGAAVP